MNNWNIAPFVRLLIPFIAGIIAAVYFPLSINYISVLVSIFFLIISIIVLIPRLYLPYKRLWIFGVLSFSILFLLGFQLCISKTGIYSSNHFSNVASPYSYMHCVIVEPIVEKENTIKAVVEVKAFFSNNTIPTKGRIIARFKKTEKSLKLNYGDEFIGNSIIKDIPPPQNPGEFNYKGYLTFQNINYQCFFNDKNWLSINKNSANPVFENALQLRNYLLSIFQKHNIKGKEYAVGSALLLGYEDKLDAEIIASYSSTGALHVLSVSGLHVGIVFIVFNWLLFFFDKFKYGNIVKGGILLLLLWFYATLTGLSPSVLRSATMFSFIIGAQILNKKTNIYNILALSGFFLLLIDPYLIMDVGFQLSYLAVVGIVFIQPKIYKWFEFNNRIIDSIWTISSVSIAAQIATFPLGLHYFHQFPNYFLFSNLIVIPLSTIIIYLGLSIFVFAKLSFVTGYLAIAFNATVWLLNYIVEWMEHLPFAIIQGISITVFETWLIYAFITMLMLYFIKRKYNYLAVSLVIGVGILIYQVVEQHNQFKQEKLIVYNIPKTSAIDFVNGKQNVFYTDSSFASNQSRLLFHVKHNWWELGLDKSVVISSDFKNDFVKIDSNFIQFSKLRVKLIKNKSDMVFSDAHSCEVDFIIVSGNPTIKIKNVVKFFSFKKIIFDSSTNSYQLKKWVAECKELNVEHYAVSESGAFIFEGNAL